MHQLFKLYRHRSEVRFETFPLDLPACRRRESGGCQTDGPIAGQRNYTFDRALAEGLGAEQHGSAIILKRAGDELGLSRRPAVDQRDKRQTVGKIARGGADPFDAGGFAALDDDDVALVDEGVGNRDRTIEGAAGVVP